jgi:hypothetical protein
MEKRQGAGAVQDANANDGSRLREASWTAVALYRSCGRTRNGRKNERDVAWSRSFNAAGIFRQTDFQNSICAASSSFKF